MQWKKCRFRFRDTLQTGRKTTPGRLLRTFSRNWFRRWIFFWIKTFDFLEIKIKIKDWLNQKEIVFRFQNIKKRQERSTTFFHSKLITSEFSDSHADGWSLWRPFSLNFKLAIFVFFSISKSAFEKKFPKIRRCYSKILVSTICSKLHLNLISCETLKSLVYLMWNRQTSKLNWK